MGTMGTNTEGTTTVEHQERMFPPPHESQIKAERDLVALGIAVCAICLFVATGGTVLPDVIRSFDTGTQAPSHLLATALFLNIALIIFSWRRYRQLREEIAIRMQAERDARRLSATDPLTGCLNRRAMAEHSERQRHEANANGEALAYVLIDVDNFKQINDMHGHTVGDAVLLEFARRVQEVLPGGVNLARIGGDEFGFTYPYDPATPERVEDLVLRIYEKLSRPIETETNSMELAISIGMATDYEKDRFNPLVNSAADLMQFADIAMYHAKKQGKNRFFWFEPSMESELRFRNELETGIRRGLTEGEFVPYYEQQIDIETGEIVGFEMLARWRSPQFGLVSPEIFIPIAEEMGVISDLSDQLMDRAFIDANEWSDDITLSINISPVQLRDPWFAQKLLKRLVQAQFPPHRLDIEITESCLHENIGLVRSMITSLRNQGVRVSLDDFGTGYSSLEQLRTLPFDRLKIDRSFISELASPMGNSRIVDAIVSIGRGLDMPITAEGIEDEEILAALQRMGDLKGQGYLYGRPEPADEVRERLGEKGLLGELSEGEPALTQTPKAGIEGDAEPEPGDTGQVRSRAS
ncbi:MAG: EAL domain-containing protein [Erythrobacter sp.]|uniref:putative bifunctional diguanylate cyclase/phosphodiesterase n=1 Tax=Erythrobacter sp. TaxID=1042 RepID=UPI002615ADCB|nr:EAL domain-containing protein [Erythrobacter sp.]MDJ0977228.1 EAL domain-containing protein [Erythrobacter sp.]